MQPSIWEDVQLLDWRIAVALGDLHADTEKLTALLHQRDVLMEELGKRWRAQRETPVLENERRRRE